MSSASKKKKNSYRRTSPEQRTTPKQLVTFVLYLWLWRRRRRGVMLIQTRSPWFPSSLCSVSLHLAGQQWRPQFIQMPLFFQTGPWKHWAVSHCSKRITLLSLNAAHRWTSTPSDPLPLSFGCFYPFFILSVLEARLVTTVVSYRQHKVELSTSEDMNGEASLNWHERYGTVWARKQPQVLYTHTHTHCACIAVIYYTIRPWVSCLTWRRTAVYFEKVHPGFEANMC